MTSHPAWLKACTAGGTASIQLDDWVASRQLNWKRCTGTTTDSTSCVRNGEAGTAHLTTVAPGCQLMPGRLCKEQLVSFQVPSAPDTVLEKWWHFDCDSLKAVGCPLSTQCELSLSSEGKCVHVKGAEASSIPLMSSSSWLQGRYLSNIVIFRKSLKLSLPG